MKIRCLIVNGTDGPYDYHYVGRNNVTRIEDLGKNGKTPPVKWFSVWRDDGSGEYLHSHFNVKYVIEIVYEREINK